MPKEPPTTSYSTYITDKRKDAPAPQGAGALSAQLQGAQHRVCTVQSTSYAHERRSFGAQPAMKDDPVRGFIEACQGMSE